MMRTCDLKGAALDAAVARCEGKTPSIERNMAWIRIKNQWIHYTPSTDWSQGGPIIEREEIGLKRRAPCMKGEEWEAMGSITAKGAGYRHAVGPTPLIAAMRCYVASKLGDEVTLPEGL